MNSASRVDGFPRPAGDDGARRPTSRRARASARRASRSRRAVVSPSAARISSTSISGRPCRPASAMAPEVRSTWRRTSSSPRSRSRSRPPAGRPLAAASLISRVLLSQRREAAASSMSSGGRTGGSAKVVARQRSVHRSSRRASSAASASRRRDGRERAAVPGRRGSHLDGSQAQLVCIENLQALLASVEDRLAAAGGLSPPRGRVPAEDPARGRPARPGACRASQVRLRQRPCRRARARLRRRACALRRLRKTRCLSAACATAVASRSSRRLRSPEAYRRGQS